MLHTENDAKGANAVKRILSMLLSLCALLCLPIPARAEMPEAVEYRGGIVERGRWRAQIARARLAELTVAYLEADTRYLVSGCPATFTVHAAGGDGAYSYAFGVYYRRGTTGSLSRLYSRERSAKPSLTYTPAHDLGQYMLLVSLYDEAGEAIVWQSQIFEVFPSGAEADASTVPGRVRQLATECLTRAGRSDYARALWLHDWLIFNADYDTSYTYYYADGVLLRGTGVCQSYALAYELLLHEIGIESVYITGTANGDSHAWNLVKLDGLWYHVDCTWDDPVGGGGENHRYFGLTDEQMALDHSWARERGLLPECTSSDLSALRQGLMVGFSDEADFQRQLSQLVTEGVSYAALFRTGGTAFDLKSAFQRWYSENRYMDGLHGYYNARFSTDECEVYLNLGEPYPGTAQVQRAVLRAHTLYLPIGERDALDFVHLPERATEGLQWTSDNEGAVTVENGIVRAVGAGSATIRLSCAGGSDECRVFVFTSDALTLPEGLEALETEAFAGTSGVQTVRLPRSLATIESRAFADCEALLFVFFASADAEIAPDAFEGCGNLTIYAPAGGTVAAFARENGLRFAVCEP